MVLLDVELDSQDNTYLPLARTSKNCTWVDVASLSTPHDNLQMR